MPKRLNDLKLRLPRPKYQAENSLSIIQEEMAKRKKQLSILNQEQDKEQELVVKKSYSQDFYLPQQRMRCESQNSQENISNKKQENHSQHECKPLILPKINKSIEYYQPDTYRVIKHEYQHMTPIIIRKKAVNKIISGNRMGQIVGNVRGN